MYIAFVVDSIRRRRGCRRRGPMVPPPPTSSSNRDSTAVASASAVRGPPVPVAPGARGPVPVAPGAATPALPRPGQSLSMAWLAAANLNLPRTQTRTQISSPNRTTGRAPGKAGFSVTSSGLSTGHRRRRPPPPRPRRRRRGPRRVRVTVLADSHRDGLSPGPSPRLGHDTEAARRRAGPQFGSDYH